MPYEATVFNVLIVSPGDVEDERQIVRDTIHEWNAAHSKFRHQILYPVGWDTHSHPAMSERPQGILNNQIVDDADLLIAVFWTRIGTPTGQAVSGSVEEIERHIKAGKPAMIYFSSVPVPQEKYADDQYRALKEIRDRWKNEGLIETFHSRDELRHKLTRQLATKINDYPIFQDHRSASPLTTGDVEPRAPLLSDEAQTLLKAAAKDKNGQILRWNGATIKTNYKEFAEEGNARSWALWQGALNELSDLGLIEPVGHKGEIFQVTNEGYKLTEQLE
jgi:hypothetical protein